MFAPARAALVALGADLDPDDLAAAGVGIPP